MSMDSTNAEFKLAADFVNHTGRHVFLTGKAGTGKTTFLKHIAQTTHKKMAIVAPTGVAAINAGGVTIHSMFTLPLGIYLPGSDHDWKVNGDFVTNQTLFKNLRLNKPKKELLRELELLVIDEVSMLRADLLDEVDAVLRFVRKRPYQPFGGLQMLYIGDLYQLPPVVRAYEWNVLRNYYDSPFFFDSHVLKDSPPIYVELRKIYRQHDEEFIRILNNVRNNEVTATDLRRLHQHYRPPRDEDKQEDIITLTTHNAKADNFNRRKLDQLPGRAYPFRGLITGDFPTNALPAEMELNLKVGAQVMFIKNDTGEFRKYYNDKLATITQLSSDSITVKFKDEAKELEVPREIWENIRYYYDKRTDTVEKDVLGSFKQYPIRLAWAITIHKSQGLTFEKAIVDAGEAFAAGQVYVALSRLTSLEGLTLRSRILPGCIDTDPRVLDFARSEKTNEDLFDELSVGQKGYFYRLVVQCFEWGPFTEQVREHYETYVDRDLPDEELCLKWVEGIYKQVQEQQGMADKFTRQLEQAIPEATIDNYSYLNQRVVAAQTYFLKSLDEIMVSIDWHLTEMRRRPKSRKYQQGLKDLKEYVGRRRLEVKQAVTIVEALASGENMSDITSKLKHQREIELPGDKPPSEHKKRPQLPKLAKGETFEITLNMFKEGNDIATIAEKRGLARSTIEGHLCKYVSDGDILVEELVSRDKVEAILSTIHDSGLINASPLREKLGAKYSFTEIRAVINHYERLKRLSLEQADGQSI